MRFEQELLLYPFVLSESMHEVARSEHWKTTTRRLENAICIKQEKPLESPRCANTNPTLLAHQKTGSTFEWDSGCGTLPLVDAALLQVVPAEIPHESRVDEK